MNLLDDEGNSALHWALFNANSKNHNEIASYLIENGVDINYGNKQEGQTPLHWAAAAGNRSAIVLLIEHDVDIHKKDNRGYNVLHHAAQYNENLICYYVIQKGVPVDEVDNEGHTALHWASYLGHENLVRLLLNCRAAINQQDDKGLTPLHWAATKNRMKAARVLLENGASVNIEDNTGSTPICIAREKGYFKLSYAMSNLSAFYSNYRTSAGVCLFLSLSFFFFYRLANFFLKEKCSKISSYVCWFYFCSYNSFSYD